MKDAEETFSAQLSAYLDGQLTQRQKEKLEKALAENPALRAELEALKATASLLRRLPRESAPSDMAEGILAHLERQRLLHQGEHHHMERPSLGWLRYVAAAAVVVVGVGIGIYLLTVTRNGGPAKFDDSAGPPLARNLEPAIPSVPGADKNARDRSGESGGAGGAVAAKGEGGRLAPVAVMTPAPPAPPAVAAAKQADETDLRRDLARKEPAEPIAAKVAAGAPASGAPEGASAGRPTALGKGEAVAKGGLEPAPAEAAKPTDIKDLNDLAAAQPSPPVLAKGPQPVMPANAAPPNAGPAIMTEQKVLFNTVSMERTNKVVYAVLTSNGIATTGVEETAQWPSAGNVAVIQRSSPYSNRIDLYVDQGAAQKIVRELSTIKTDLVGSPIVQPQRLANNSVSSSEQAFDQRGLESHYPEMAMLAGPRTVAASGPAADARVAASPLPKPSPASQQLSLQWDGHAQQRPAITPMQPYTPPGVAGIEAQAAPVQQERQAVSNPIGPMPPAPTTQQQAVAPLQASSGGREVGWNQQNQVSHIIVQIQQAPANTGGLGGAAFPASRPSTAPTDAP